MKTYFILIIFISFQASAQNPKFPKQKITQPCTQEFLDNYIGKWLIPNQFLSRCPSQNYSQQTMKRIAEVHKLVLEVYPQPISSDAIWTGSYFKDEFAIKVKYNIVEGNSQRELVAPNQVEGWGYTTVIFPWSCSGANEMYNGYPEVGNGSSITVEANRLPILSEYMSDGDEWTIEGRPIKKKMPKVGTWKGYEIMASNGGAYAQQNDMYYILLSRNDMLPFIPVTRKQYLDRAMAYSTRFYDNTISIYERMTDKAEKEKNVSITSKQKDVALKKIHDELEKTTRDGLLDAPAVIGTDPLMMNEGPVFLPEAEGGFTLVTDNPNYFRRTAPGYIPQFFVLSWSWGRDKLSADFKRAIEENFAVEKLQAMIDK